MLTGHSSISIGQAVFTSSQGSTGRGYHLVARSPMVRDALASQLSRWGPAHGSLLAEANTGSSLNFMPIDGQWTTISRTMYGGPEYSRRGALQVVTVILALHREQLAGYDNNPITLAETAMLLGYLRLPAEISNCRADVELPAKSPSASICQPPSDSKPPHDLSLLSQLLDRGERIAIVADHSASSMLHEVFERSSSTRRLQLSFTTGLKPSPVRPFQLHLLPFVNQQIHRQLNALGVRLVGPAV